MKTLVAAIAICAALPAGADTLGPYTDLVVFGDSFSDSGNVAILADNYLGGFDYTAYPYGQFTDGDVWATQLGLTPSLDGGTNYAYGGARAAENGDIIPDLDAQIATYIADAPALGDNPLGAIFIGGNDFRDFAAGGAGGGDPFVVGAFIASLITEISDAAVTLATTPINDIVVFGLPDIGKMPDLVGTAFGLAVTEVVNAYNSSLVAAVAGLDALLSTTQVSFFDTNSLLQDILNNPEAYGFTNTTGKCLFDGAACDPSTYVFWDGIHPTSGIHALYASSFAASLAPVPLPAGFPLLFGALTFLALVRRRQRSLA